MIFSDRTEAGKLLAKKLTMHTNDPHTVVIGLPRGGIPVAFEIAQNLQLSLDIVCPRKIGAPNNPEFAIGAIDEEGNGILHEEIIEEYGISQKYIDQTISKEKEESARRLSVYRAGQKPIHLKNKTVILVDDGIATGATMKAALASARKKGAKKVIVAVPVIAMDTLTKLRSEADGIVYLNAPLHFGAVGAFYERFDQTLDVEVIELMRIAREKE